MGTIAPTTPKRATGAGGDTADDVGEAVTD